MSFDTKILKVDPKAISFKKGTSEVEITDNHTQRNLEQAAEQLKTTSNPVAFPTETVYGLGGSGLNTDSVLAIYKAKNRPADNPLILHVSSIEQLERRLQSKVPDIYLPLLEKFWPGPLTILLPVPENSNISPACTVGQSTFAVRMPSHPVARALIQMSDLPLAAPSANASTRPSTTKAEHVLEDLHGRIPVILDGGDCDVGVESTVIDGLVDPPMLLRPGGVSLEDIKKYGGEAWANTVVARSTAKENETVKTPGMKYKHYSPKAPVALFVNCDASKFVQFVSNYEPKPSKIGLLRTRNLDDSVCKQFGNGIEQVIDRSLGTSGHEISHNLFASLRELDQQGAELILVEAIDEANEGLAVMNRLKKASSVVITDE